MKIIAIITLVLSSTLSAMQSQFNNDFSMRFGPDSHIYNTPLYFGTVNHNNKKTPKKHKVPVKNKPVKKHNLTNMTKN